MNLPTPAIRPVWGVCPDEQVETWLWELREPWHFRVKGVECRLDVGFRWNGASKPLRNKAFLATPASHWPMVVPSMEHDELCRHRLWWAANGVSSVDAAEHFYGLCKAYGTGAEWTQYKMVLWFGPKWDATNG